MHETVKLVFKYNFVAEDTAGKQLISLYNNTITQFFIYGDWS